VRLPVAVGVMPRDGGSKNGCSKFRGLIAHKV